MELPEPNMLFKKENPYQIYKMKIHEPHTQSIGITVNSACTVLAIIYVYILRCGCRAQYLTVEQTLDTIDKCIEQTIFRFNFEPYDALVIAAS